MKDAEAALAEVISEGRRLQATGASFEAIEQQVVASALAHV